MTLDVQPGCYLATIACYAALFPLPGVTEQCSLSPAVVVTTLLACSGHVRVDRVCTGLSLAMCVAASGRMQLKKKTPTRPSIQQLQGSMSAMGLQDSNTR